MPQSTPGGSGGRGGAAIALLGGAAAIVGAFLSWMTVTPTGADPINFAGWTLTGDAKIVAGIGAVAVVASVIVLAGSMRSMMRVVLFLAGLGIVGVGAYDVYDIINKLPNRLEAANVGSADIKTPGIGLIIVFAGAALVLIGSLAMRPKRGNPLPSATPPLVPQPNAAVNQPGTPSFP